MFSIEISTGSEINEDLHDGVEISLGIPVDGLNLDESIMFTVRIVTKLHLSQVLS